MPSVRISSAGKIVEVDRHVKLRPGMELNWVPQDGGQRTITFLGDTPFPKTQYTAPPEMSSGAANGPVGQFYTYEVRLTPTGSRTDVGLVEVVESLADVDAAVLEANAKAFSLAVGGAV
jgi:hypothetical protein